MRLKKRWRNFPIWLKGGILGALFILIIGIVLFILTSYCFTIKGNPCNLYNSSNETVEYEAGACLYENLKECNIYSIPLMYLGKFPLLFFVNSSNSYYGSLNGAILLNIVIILDSAVTGFLIGVAISLIYRKIKSRA